MKKNLIFGFIVVVMVTGAVALVKTLQIRKLMSTKMVPPPSTVATES